MPGYYIRTASGIVPVRDWYVRTAAGIQKVREAYIRTAAGIQKYYPAVTGTEALNTTSTVAANGGIPAQIGYQRHTLALADFGTIGSAAVTGGFVLEQLCRQQSGSGNLFGLSATGSTFPPDADTTWQRVEATGVFADSGGLSVTRTLLRTDSGTPVNNLESGRAYRSWNFATQTMPFIVSNTYTVKVYTSLKREAHMQNGHATQPPVNINPMQAAVYALQFLENVPHARHQRDQFDMAVGMLQAIASGQVVLAPPPGAPTMPDIKPEAEG